MNAHHFFTSHGMPVPRTGDWRMTKAEVGQIHGLPLSHGTLRATDGVLCYIERATDLFVGHLAWWEKDEREQGHSSRPSRKTKEQPDISRYI